MTWYAQDDVNQEDSEQNEVDGMYVCMYVYVIIAKMAK